MSPPTGPNCCPKRLWSRNCTRPCGWRGYVSRRRTANASCDNSGVPHHAEAGVATTERGMDRVALGTAGKGPIVIPVAAADHFELAAVRAERIFLRRGRRWGVPVGAPFPHV